jgi:hypothetical protein
MMSASDATWTASAVITAADRSIANGWCLVVVEAGAKKPAFNGWDKRSAIEGDFRSYAEQFSRVPNIGISLDRLLMVDIDADDELAARNIRHRVEEVLGAPALMRHGRPPRVALFYGNPKSVRPSRTKLNGLELRTGRSLQAVAFGRHPDGMLYMWEGPSPADTSRTRLDTNPVSSDQLEALVGLFGVRSEGMGRGGKRAPPAAPGQSTLRAGNRRIRDGRDGHATSLVASVVRKALKAGISLDPTRLATEAWTRFQNECDLSRPRGNGKGPWCYGDIYRKVARLLGRQDIQRKLFGSKVSARFWTLDQKSALLTTVRSSSLLTESEFKVATAMIDAVNDDRGVCEMSAETIAQRAGVGTSTATRARLKLISLGFFLLVSRGSRRGHRPRGKATVVTPNCSLVGDVHTAIDGSDTLVPSEPDGALHPVSQPVDTAQEYVRPQHDLSMGLHNHLPPPQESLQALISQIHAVADKRDLFGWPAVDDTDRRLVSRLLGPLRMQSGESRVAFAQRLGLTRSYLGDVERGRRTLSREAVHRLMELADLRASP